MSNIGMMDAAFFVGRSELVAWVNNTLDVSIGKIEETAFRGLACQFMDIMYPGQLPMSKVNWGAKTEPEFVANYKLLQTVMNKNSVDKFVDVDRLVKGRYQDNLEFMQWFKRFFELKVSDLPADYDAQAVRLKGKGGDKYNQIHIKGGTGSKASGRLVPKPRGAAATKPTTAPTRNTTARSTSAPAMKENRVAPRVNTTSARQTVSSPVKKKTSPSTTSAANTTEMKALREANEASTKALSELKLEMDGLEKERDFYFEKLRDVEIMLQDLEDKGEGNELSASIFKILYATADGFEQAEELEEGTTVVEEEGVESVDQLSNLEENVVEEDVNAAAEEMPLADEIESMTVQSMTSSMVEQESY